MQTTNVIAADNVTARFSSKQILWFFCLAHVVVWTIASSMLQQNGPLDVIEAIAWGQQWQLGYDRDPYLIAWLANIASVLGGGGIWSVYLLSQLCIVATFWAVWRTARLISLTPAQSLLAVLVLEGICYYHFITPEFNDNVLQLPFWALTITYFYSALTTQRTSAWLWTGLFAGLALMAKYFTVMLFAPMALVLMLTQHGRASFKKPGLYIAAVIGLIIIAPNLYWQYANQFQYIHYAIQRSDVPASWLNHIWLPLKFLLVQLGIVLPALLIFWLSKGKGPTPKVDKQVFTSRFVLLVTFGPLFFTALYSMITGDNIRAPWAAPLFSFLGVFLVYGFHTRDDAPNTPRAAMLAGLSFAISVIIYFASTVGTPYVLGYAKTAQFPSQSMADSVTRMWREQYQRQVPYVIGRRQFSARMAVYSADHPTPIFDWNSKTSPWVHLSDIQKRGAVLIWDKDKYGMQLPKPLARYFPGMTKARALTIPYATGADIPPLRIAVAFLPPRGVAAE